MKVPFLDLKKMDDSLKSELQIAFGKALDEGVFSGGNPVNSLVENLKQFLGAGHLIPLGNGTDALELALRALAIEPGDEVIVPALTWVSTAEVIKLLGAVPVFVDTDSDGLISSEWVNLVNQKTKAVIPVHLYGKMVDMEALCKEAKNRNLFVIEDAAQAFGASQKGKAAGTWGEVGAFSFYPTKNLGALGEAGACFTKDEGLARMITLFANHGQIKRDEHLILGRNARMDTLQAIFLNVLLKYFNEFQATRKAQAKKYLDVLSEIEEIVLPKEILRENHNAHLFVIQIERRDELKEYLDLKGIGTAIHYPEILPDMLPFACEGQFENARKISQNCLSLPLNPYLSPIEQEQVLGSIVSFFK